MPLGYDDVEYLQKITYEQVHGVAYDKDLLWLASLQPPDDEARNHCTLWCATSMSGRYKTRDPPNALNIPSRPSILPDFDMLPVEMVQAILARLDFRSLKYFSETCSKARGFVRSLPEFRAFVYHIPEFLRFLDKLGIVECYSAGDMYTAFRTPFCETCGCYTTYFHLPTCQRYCWRCWRQHRDRFFVVPESMFAWFPDIALGLKTKPILRARFLPRAQHRGNMMIFSRANLATIAEQLHQSGRLWWQLMRAWRTLKREHPFSHDPREDLWDSWSMSKALQRPATQPILDPTIEETSAFLRDIERESYELLLSRLPYLGDTGQIERDLYCRVCAYASHRHEISTHASIRVEGSPASYTYMPILDAANLCWTRGDFFQHIRECPCIKILMSR